MRIITKYIGNRRYLLGLPNNFRRDISYPLVFLLHGGGSNPTMVLYESRFEEVVDQYEIVLVIPAGSPIGSGLLERTTQLYWNCGKTLKPSYGNPFRGVDDVTFMENIFNSVSSLVKIDYTKVFAGGYSNGGYMAIRLAQQWGRLSRISVLGAHRFPNDYFNLNKPIPYYQISGALDMFCPFIGRVGELDASPYVDDIKHRPAVATFNEWVRATSPNYHFITNTTPLTKNIYRITSPYKCQFDVIMNGGHTWPGGRSELTNILGPINNEYLASQQMAKFFLGMA